MGSGEGRVYVDVAPTSGGREASSGRPSTQGRAYQKSKCQNVHIYP